MDAGHAITAIFLSMLVGIGAFTYMHESAHAHHCRYFGGEPEVLYFSGWFPDPRTICRNLDNPGLYYLAAAMNESFSYQLVAVWLTLTLQVALLSMAK